MLLLLVAACSATVGVGAVAATSADRCAAVATPCKGSLGCFSFTICLLLLLLLPVLAAASAAGAGAAAAISPVHFMY